MFDDNRSLMIYSTS